MEEELTIKFDNLEMGDELTNSDQFSAQDDANNNSQGFHHNSATTENCNLIVNYLPHDIDDLSLKVNKQK